MFRKRKEPGHGDRGIKIPRKILGSKQNQNRLEKKGEKSYAFRKQ